MAGATGRIQGRVLGSFPLVLPVGDVSISKGRNKTLFSTFRRLLHPIPGWGWGCAGRAGIIIVASIYQAFAIGQALADGLNLVIC